MEPLRLFPQCQLLGSQASANPAGQFSELLAAVGYPEVVGESTQYRVQVVDDLGQIDWCIAPGDPLHLGFELSNLLALYACVPARDDDSEIGYAFAAVNDPALAFVDPQVKGFFQIVSCHVEGVFRPAS